MSFRVSFRVFSGLFGSTRVFSGLLGINKCVFSGLLGINKCVFSGLFGSFRVFSVKISALLFNEELDLVCRKTIDPVKIRKISMHQRSAWISLEHKEAIQEKRRAEGKWKKTELQVHRDVYLHQVKTSRNLCEDCISRF